MPTPKLPETTRAKIVSLLTDGSTSYLEISRKCKVSSGTVARVAAEIGTAGRRKKEKAERKRRVHESAKAGGTYAQIAGRAKVSRATAARYAAESPDPEFVPPDGTLPPACPERFRPHLVDTPGHWLILSDVHLPYHDRGTVEAAVERAKRDRAIGVILNGDILDSHEVSDHDKDPSAPRYVKEVDVGVRFLAWVRSQLPKAEIIFKQGNHEERLDRYVFGRAPALFGLEGLNLRALLHLDDYGITEVRDKRIIQMGKLNLVHGHEYRGGGGVMPARWLYLKAGGVAMCGHFHRTSEHHRRNIADRHEAAWSVGCACSLTPAYAPLNEWNHGFAMVELSKGGDFTARNFRMLAGKVV